MFVKQLLIYPIKSLPGLNVNDWPIEKSGGLKFDRAFRVVRASDGKLVNCTREPKMTLPTFSEIEISSEFNQSLKLKIHFPSNNFCVFDSAKFDRQEISKSFSQLLGYEVWLDGDGSSYFPDDLESSGPTIVSENSLNALAEFMDFDSEEAVRRLRPNIIFGGSICYPFCEDKFVNLKMTIGADESRKSNSPIATKLSLTNICKRCVVPARDSKSGETNLKEFYGKFLEFRAKYNEADPGYRMTLNTIVENINENPTISINDKIVLTSN